MAISGVDPKCYILALFVRDDGVRFLLGDDPFEFKDKQLHFQPNTVANDVVEVQGNDGYLLAGQVRRPGTQMFDGYVCNGTNSKEEVEVKRRAFLQFFRRSHFYKVIYVFPNGTAIQRKQGFLVDDPTVQELYQQYPEYHVALNFEDVNYYTYEEDDEGHEIYAKEAIIKLAGGGATGGLIWDNNGVVWESPWSGLVTVSGVDFQVDNLLPIRVPIDDSQLKGDTYQQTYSGKNLFSTQGSSSPSVVTGLNSFYLEKPNERTNQFNMVLSLPVGTYTLSYDVSKNAINTDGVRCGVYGYDGGNVLFGNVTKYDGHVEYTFNATVPVHHLYFFINNSMPDGAAVNVTNVQIETGSSATAFEPYVGGIPAPNPDYPQDVQTVTGEQTVEVSGKNLWGNISQYGRSTNGINFVTNQDGTISATGTATANAYSVLASAAVGAGVYITLSAGTYTLSEKNNNTVQAYEAVAGSQVLADTSTSTVTFTLTETKNIVIRAVVLNGQAISGTLIFYPMLESGSTTTTYQPYQSKTYPISLGSIELCKLGNYQDYIYKNGDDWYVHKACGKAVLDGSNDETWNTANLAYYVTLQDKKRDALGYCDNFTYSPLNWSSSDATKRGTCTGNKNETGLYFMPLDASQSSLALFKTWLSTNPTTAYYILATATDTKITNATLVEQLEALAAMRLFIGKNNILVSTPAPNLPATLQFGYYTQSLEPHGAEWEEGGTKGATIVDVDAIDNTYPVWELVGPAINPTISVLTTNTTLTYNGTITASQNLVIDMFNKTATLNGTSVIGNVTGEFVYMEPGTNRVAYTAGNADAPDSKISWQEVVG